MILLHYAICVISDDGYSWLGYFEGDRYVQYYKDFRNAHLFNDLQTASLLCDTLNSIIDTRVFKVCSVNIIINED